MERRREIEFPLKDPDLGRPWLFWYYVLRKQVLGCFERGPKFTRVMTRCL